MAEVDYSLTDVVGAVNAKIEELRDLQREIERAVRAEVSLGINVLALEHVSSSLNAAQQGLDALKRACCNDQNCTFTYEPAPVVPVVPGRPAAR